MLAAYGVEPNRRRDQGLAGSSGTFWWVRGYWTEGRRWLREALAAAGTQQPRARSKALEAAAHLAFRQMDYSEARRLADESLALARKLGDASRMARTLRVMALVAEGEGDSHCCRDLVEQSARFARKSADTWALIMALNNLGFLALEASDAERATEHLEEALELAVTGGDQRGQALILGNLALAKLMEGSIDAAREDFVTSLRLAHGLRFLEVASGDMLGIAAIVADQGAFVDAARLLGGAQRILDEIGADRDRVEAPIYVRVVEVIERELGREDFVAALRQGGEFAFDDVVELAMRSRD